MSKSYASVEYKICPVTGIKHSTGILLDRRLKESLDSETITGFAFSPDVQKKLNEGFIAVIEIDESKSKKGEIINNSGAYRTGRLCYIRKSVADELFERKVESMAFAGIEIFSELVEMYEKLKEENDTTEGEKSSDNGES